MNNAMSGSRRCRIVEEDLKGRVYSPGHFLMNGHSPSTGSHSRQSLRRMQVRPSMPSSPYATVCRPGERSLDNNGFKGTTRPPNLAFARDSPESRKGGVVGSICPQPCCPRPNPVDALAERFSSDITERYVGEETVGRQGGQLPENKEFEEKSRPRDLAFASDVAGLSDGQGDSVCRGPYPLGLS